MLELQRIRGAAKKTQQVSSETVSRFKHYLSKGNKLFHEQWTSRVWFPTNASFVFLWSCCSDHRLPFLPGGYITIFSVLHHVPWSFLLNLHYHCCLRRSCHYLTNTCLSYACAFWPVSVRELPGQENNAAELMALPFLQRKLLFGPLISQNLSRNNTSRHVSTLI